MAHLLSRLRDTLRTLPPDDTTTEHHIKAFRPGHIDALYNISGATDSSTPRLEDDPPKERRLGEHSTKLDYQQKIQDLNTELTAVYARLEESMNENKKLQEHDQAMQQRLEVSRTEIQRLRRRLFEELVEES